MFYTVQTILKYIEKSFVCKKKGLRVNGMQKVYVCDSFCVHGFKIDGKKIHRHVFSFSLKNMCRIFFFLSIRMKNKRFYNYGASLICQRMC